MEPEQKAAAFSPEPAALGDPWSRPGLDLLMNKDSRKKDTSQAPKAGLGDARAPRPGWAVPPYCSAKRG